MQRISIVGSSGSGKTSLARIISERLGIPHLELDAVNHQPDWKPLPHEEFQAAVRPLVAEVAWVIDGNYRSTGVQDIVWGRADTVIWLDLPRWTTIRRVTARSIKRSATREELWNGNREQWTNLIHPNPEINIVMWTWTRYAQTRTRYESDSESDERGNVHWIRLRSQREIDEFVADL
jgi:adenylate kinase family enzyme